MKIPMSLDNKNFYTHYADKILDKRFNSPNLLRRYVHRAQYDSVAKHVQRGESVIDIGCGEGVLSCLLAQKGARVVGVDISEPNIKAAKELAERLGVINRASFLVADAEKVPFPDNSFDVAVSCNVLEHLPDFDKSLKEVYRLARDKAIIALPTLLNFCSIIQVGHGSFWEKSFKSLLALPVGLWKTVSHLGREGVDEGYGGHKELSHIWRYPWIIKKRLKKEGFKIVSFEASSICLPYFVWLLPLIKLIDCLRSWPIIRNFGYGTMVVLKRNIES